MERNTTTMAGWINELRLLGEHPAAGKDWVRDAIRTIVRGMESVQQTSEDRTLRGKDLIGEVTYYKGHWWQIESIDYFKRAVHLRKVDVDDDAVVLYRHRRQHSMMAHAERKAAVDKLLAGYKIACGPIFFNTDRAYTAHGQRIGAQELEDGSIIFCDIDRNIQGRFTPAVVVEYRIDLTQTQIMWGYDHHDLTQYWVNVYQFDEQICALQKATRAHFAPPVDPEFAAAHYNDGRDLKE